MIGLRLNYNYTANYIYNLMSKFAAKVLYGRGLNVAGSYSDIQHR